MLKEIQAALPKAWTQESYSDTFNASPSEYRDFQHALWHVVKATAKLGEMVEIQDHAEREVVNFRKEDVEKYLADIVISSVRLAIKNPSGKIDLESAVLRRLKQKMDLEIKAE